MVKIKVKDLVEVVRGDFAGKRGVVTTLSQGDPSCIIKLDNGVNILTRIFNVRPIPIQ